MLTQCSLDCLSLLGIRWTGPWCSDAQACWQVALNLGNISRCVAFDVPALIRKFKAKPCWDPWMACESFTLQTLQWSFSELIWPDLTVIAQWCHVFQCGPGPAEANHFQTVKTIYSQNFQDSFVFSPPCDVSHYSLSFDCVAPPRGDTINFLRGMSKYLGDHKVLLAAEPKACLSSAS